jgi:hypothetical protein
MFVSSLSRMAHWIEPIETFERLDRKHALARGERAHGQAANNVDHRAEHQRHALEPADDVGRDAEPIGCAGFGSDQIHAAL